MYKTVGIPWIPEADYAQMQEICRGLPATYMKWRKRTFRLIEHAGNQSEFMMLVPMGISCGCNRYYDLHERADQVAAAVGPDFQ